MKNLVLLLSILLYTLSFYSCNRQENISIFPQKAEYSINDNNEQNALKNFSIALSKIICSSKDVRDFIKNNAIKKIDNDYDVFYPFVKNKLVTQSETFRSILSKALTKEVSLDHIERILPTLTIYVPDMTWIDASGFSAESWDTSNPKTAVTYRNSNGYCEDLFSNGYYLGRIKKGTIPGGNILIVKKNERIIANLATKSAEISYNFIDSVYNNYNQPRTRIDRHSGEYWTSQIGGQDSEDNSDVLPAFFLNMINPNIVKSYELCRNVKDACQNDYIYYGMTSPTDTIGHLNYNVRAKILRFQISPSSFDAIFDDPITDKKFIDCYETDDDGGRRKEPSIEELYSKFWADGALEINLKIFTGTNNGTATMFSNHYYDVKASDLFTLNKGAILKEHWGSTMFKWYITWRYSLRSRDKETLSAKWYYPDKSPNLPTWDLTSNSGYTIVVSEKDASATITREMSISTRKASSNTAKIDFEGKLGRKNENPLKIGFGWSSNDEETHFSKVVVSYQEADDELLTQDISYNDKYITGKLSDDLYIVSSYESERFTFTILPYVY